MLRRFRDRFGAAGLAIAIAAFILAIGGTALAASGALTGKQKKEVKSIAKSFAGKPGAQGPQGPKGDPGAAAKDGAPGQDGASATTAVFSGAQHGCTEGGIEVKSASPTTYVCNGETGQPGEAGPLLETLPAGKTMKGQWITTVTEVPGETPSGVATVNISFPFPLGERPSLTVFLAEEGEDEADCPGTAEAPEAAAGVLCLYPLANQGEIGTFAAAPSTKFGASPLLFGGDPGSFAAGTWAVTAE
jgi:hypothetical protein